MKTPVGWDGCSLYRICTWSFIFLLQGDAVSLVSAWHTVCHKFEFAEWKEKGIYFFFFLFLTVYWLDVIPYWIKQILKCVADTMPKLYFCLYGLHFLSWTRRTSYVTCKKQKQYFEIIENKQLPLADSSLAVSFGRNARIQAKWGNYFHHMRCTDAFWGLSQQYQGWLDALFYPSKLHEFR